MTHPSDDDWLPAARMATFFPELSYNQFKNLIAFLCVAGNEDCYAFLDKSPDYLMEKYSRYAGTSALRDDDGWRWGLHPALRCEFDTYCEKWKLNEFLSYEDFNNKQAEAEIDAYERDRLAGKTVEPPDYDTPYDAMCFDCLWPLRGDGACPCCGSTARLPRP